jgi:hypothetical protein
MYTSQTGYADVLLGFFVYHHTFFGGIHVAQNIPVIIDNTHGSNVTYYSLFTPSSKNNEFTIDFFHYNYVTSL